MADIFIADGNGGLEFEDAPPPPPFPSFDLTDLDGDFLADADPSLIANHCGLGTSRLLSQFSCQDTITGFMCALLDTIQEVEQNFADIRYLRKLSVATGVWLTWLAGNWGVQKGGLTEDELKLIMQGEAVLRVNDGTPDETLEALETMTDAAYSADLSYTPAYPAGAEFTFKVAEGQHEFGTCVAQVLEKSRPAGTNVNYLWEEDGLYFGFDEDPSAGPFGETVDDASAGTWAEAS